MTTQLKIEKSYRRIVKSGLKKMRAKFMWRSHLAEANSTLHNKVIKYHKIWNELIFVVFFCFAYILYETISFVIFCNSCSLKFATVSFQFLKTYSENCKQIVIFLSNLRKNVSHRYSFCTAQENWACNISIWCYFLIRRPQKQFKKQKNIIKKIIIKKSINSSAKEAQSSLLLCWHRWWLIT